MTIKTIEVREKRLKKFIKFFGVLCRNATPDFNAETSCNNCPLNKTSGCDKTAMKWLKGGE